MGKEKENENDRMLLFNTLSMMPMLAEVSRHKETNNPKLMPGKNIPGRMILSYSEPGVYMGAGGNRDNGAYVGRRSKDDGNILLTGISGSGKSRILVKSSLETWRNPAVVLDIKGELSEHMDSLQREGIETRPFIVFDPIQGGKHYDVYAVLYNNYDRLAQNVREIVHAIIPMPADVQEPYWINMARDYLSGVIVYYFEQGYSFIETILLMQTKSVDALCEEINYSNCYLAKIFISDISSLKKEQKASIGTEVKQYTMVFATDSDIQNALSEEKGIESFSWDDIVMSEDAPFVFLRLDQSRLEQWSVVIRLMVTQLIRVIERRPDKYSSCGRETKPLLILLDEFPLLGKMDIITDAMTTLRSKNVTLYLVIQSIAQLDAVYGPDVRKILVDNCQYKMFLNVTEPETQEYLSKMFGSIPTTSVSVFRNYNCMYNMDPAAIGSQVQESREPLIYPHEFAANKDIWLFTPYGFLSTCKLPSKATRPRSYMINDCLRRLQG